ncbi:Hypothetical predicted protein [Olea europaea subsp. europaea]|uniref:COI1 F-box domain-containing protein n=1 Tax=Olea europaea subsp. europaea TaxID=158383 RepID=A0A8S0RWD4_OLEEU|nr:Hypothetical predicted protein [Olea europaea subsp. europaea]
MTTDTTPTINDHLSEAILSNIIVVVSDIRSRNSVALVCHKWLFLECATRTILTLCGNIRQLYMVPTSFRSIPHLDLSMLSPWGYSFTSSSADHAIIAHLLRHAFPAFTSLTLYARNSSTLQLLAPLWPNLKQVKLVRWHQRPQLATTGEEFEILFQKCKSLCSLDLSLFYCWADDVHLALKSNPLISSNLTCLNLFNPSFSKGVNPSLKEFRAACIFDPRYTRYVGDDGLVSIAMNCPKLAILYLADTSALSNLRRDPEREGFTDSGPTLEVLHPKCPKLKQLKLGQFHGIFVRGLQEDHDERNENLCASASTNIGGG